MTNFEFCRGSIHSKTTESCLLLFLCTLASVRRVAHGRSRSLACREHHRRRLRKRNMGAPLHSHFSNDTLHFHEDHLFTRTGQVFFSFASFLSLFFFLFFASFFFFFWNATAYFAQFAIRGYASALTAGGCLAETSDDSAAEEDVALPGCGTTNCAMRDAALSLTFSLCFLPSM